MTRTIHQTSLTQAERVADHLISAIDSSEFEVAKQLAIELWQQGVQSMESLIPRGTLRFAAGDRLDSQRSRELAGRLKGHGLPEVVWALIVKALGFWAGSELVPEIRDIIQQRIAKEDRFEETDSMVTALYAVHLIGGPEAVEVLREFQNEGLKLRVREAAARYLNRLGMPVIDPMFDADGFAGAASAEELRRRDRLQDPFAWQEAAAGLWKYLGFVSGPYWTEYEDTLSEHARKLIRNAADANNFEKVPSVLERTLPEFMLRFQDNRVMVLRPMECFFPPRDLIESRYTDLNEWSVLKLNADSGSCMTSMGSLCFASPMQIATTR